MVFLTGFQVKDVKAAGMSYNKAVMLYNNTVIGKWAKSGKKFKVTDDFRANGCWTAYNDVGKKARSVTTKVFRFKNGKLTRLVTLGDYVGQMDTNGKIPHTCWINKKRASVTKYKKYMKTYVDSYKKARWGP